MGLTIYTPANKHDTTYLCLRAAVSLSSWNILHASVVSNLGVIGSGEPSLREVGGRRSGSPAAPGYFFTMGSHALKRSSVDIYLINDHPRLDTAHVRCAILHNSPTTKNSGSVRNISGPQVRSRCGLNRTALHNQVDNLFHSSTAHMIFNIDRSWSHQQICSTKDDANFASCGYELVSVTNLKEHNDNSLTCGNQKLQLGSIVYQFSTQGSTTLAFKQVNAVIYKKINHAR